MPADRRWRRAKAGACSSCAIRKPRSPRSARARACSFRPSCSTMGARRRRLHADRRAQARRPALPILMLTTSASPLLAVEAMRAGATDYLVKPVAPDRLLAALRAATDPRDGARGTAAADREDRRMLDFDAMVGAAPDFRAALAIAAKAARGRMPGSDRGRKRHRQGDAGPRDARRLARARKRRCAFVNIGGDARQPDRIGAVRP